MNTGSLLNFKNKENFSRLPPDNPSHTPEDKIRSPRFSTASFKPERLAEKVD